MQFVKRAFLLAIVCVSFGASSTFALASEQVHFKRSDAKTVGQMTFRAPYRLVCSERRSVSHPDEILKTWKPDLAKVSRLSGNKTAFAKIMTASGIATNKNNRVLFRVERRGNALLTSHCLLAQSENSATYFAKNFHAFNGWGQSATTGAPCQFKVYELRKPFRDALKRSKRSNVEVFWSVRDHPQQVFVLTR